MTRRLENTHFSAYPGTGSVRAGWSQFSIVPAHPVRMAGYGIRKKFDSIRDTLYARVLAIENGSTAIYFVSVDLLLFPPMLKQLVLKKLGDSWPGFVFFGATHTHSGVGGWDPSLLGRILMGRYEQDWMDGMAQGIVDHMGQALSGSKLSTIYRWKTVDEGYAFHRPSNTMEGVDNKIRGISIVRSDSAKALLFTYSAHPTLLPKENTSLSGEYPAEIMKNLSEYYAFTQFMGGMMASHSLVKKNESNYVEHVGKILSSVIQRSTFIPLSDSLIIRTKKIPIEYGPSQLRITKNWKVRDWVFRIMLGPLQGEVNVLQMGEVLFLGMPCDFSGELSYLGRYDSLAMLAGEQLIITGFNGGYTGYITADYLYDEKSDDNEVKILNWVGPYFGRYYTEIIMHIIDGIGIDNSENEASKSL